MAVKNPTQWIPGSGKGYVVVQGTLFITNNLSSFITDNLGNFLVTTPNYVTPKNATSWTATGV